MNDLNISPILELYKGKIYIKFINLFIKDCINELGTYIFSIKKSLSRTLTNLLSSWIFCLYINYDYSGDYSLPNNFNNVESLRSTLLDLCKYDINIENIDYKINNIINHLKINYNKLLNLLDEYKKSILYLNIDKLYFITKKNIIIKKNDNSIDFYKYHIKIPYFINNIRLKKILNNIIIPITVYNKMLNNYSGNKDYIDIYLWVLIFRYQILGSNNHQLSILPNIINYMNVDYNLSFECFASSINHTCDNYCSIYYDIEKYFGSRGNFFNIIPCAGVYLFNPPFQKNIITLGINRILNFLENIDILTYIITIPIWDLYGINEMKKNNFFSSFNNIDYGEFDIINVIKKSKFFKYLQMIPKEKFTYIDHNFELYKNKTIQNTYLIVLSNTNFNTDYIKKYNYEV